MLQIFTALVNFCFFSISGWGIDLDYYEAEQFPLEMNQGHSAYFEVALKYCILDSFVDYEAILRVNISFKGFLCAVLNITSIWIKFVCYSPF